MNHNHHRGPTRPPRLNATNPNQTHEHKHTLRETCLLLFGAPQIGLQSPDADWNALRRHQFWACEQSPSPRKRPDSALIDWPAGEARSRDKRHTNHKHAEPKRRNCLADWPEVKTQECPPLEPQRVAAAHKQARRNATTCTIDWKGARASSHTPRRLARQKLAPQKLDQSLCGTEGSICFDVCVPYLIRCDLAIEPLFSNRKHSIASDELLVRPQQVRVCCVSFLSSNLAQELPQPKAGPRAAGNGHTHANQSRLATLTC